MWHDSATAKDMPSITTFLSCMDYALCTEVTKITMQVEKVQVLLSQWRGRAVILLNAEWSAEDVDSQHKAFAKSFESVYSFLPLAIQVTDIPCVICSALDAAKADQQATSLHTASVDTRNKAALCAHALYNQAILCHTCVHHLANL